MPPPVSARAHRGRRALLTLTTDIGWAYAAQMKGAILSLAPSVQLVDITHQIRPQGVGEAAFLLSHIIPAFPPGTIHVAVVDPGVGTDRQAVAIECSEGSLLLGPDNGVFAPVGARLGVRRVVRLEPSRVRPGGHKSATFEGRDLFAPAAARLATGAQVTELGDLTVLRAEKAPVVASRGPGAGRVVHVDVFGNLITDLPPDTLPAPGSSVRLSWGGPARSSGTRIVPRVRTYGELPPGALGVLVSSFGLVEVARAMGSAARTLSLGEGSWVRVSAVPSRRSGRGPHRQSL